MLLDPKRGRKKGKFSNEWMQTKGRREQGGEKPPLGGREEAEEEERLDGLKDLRGTISASAALQMSGRTESRCVQGPRWTPPPALHHPDEAAARTWTCT